MKADCWICDDMRVPNTGTLFFIANPLPILTINRMFKRLNKQIFD